MNTGSDSNRGEMSFAPAAIAATSAPVLERLVDEYLVPAEASMRSVLLIGVADEPGSFVLTFAPLSGLVTLEGIRSFAVGEAEKVARRGVGSAPAHMGVRHCVCGGWRELPALLLAHGCDGVIIDPGDPSRRQMRSIRAASARLGIDLLLGGRQVDGPSSVSTSAPSAKAPAGVCPTVS